MQTEKYRKIIIVSFALAATFIACEAIFFWKAFNAQKENPGFLTFMFLFLAFISLITLLVYSMKTSDLHSLQKTIDQAVANERAKILSELEKKNETETETMVEVEEDLEELIKEILPTGNFKSVETYSKKLLVNMANSMELTQGALFLCPENKKDFELVAGYALPDDAKPGTFKPGENLPGAVAESGETMVIEDIPDEYFSVESGLGRSKPRLLIITPIKHEGNVIGVAEISSFKSYNERFKLAVEQALDQASNKIFQLLKP